MTYITSIPSPLGLLTLSSNGTHITGLWIKGQKYFGSTLGEAGKQKAQKENDTSVSLPVFEEAKRWLDIYFSGKEPDFMPPLAPAGSGFRQMVWEILQAVPYGQTITYGQIAEKCAEKLGRASMSAQAVGGAVGHNPISIMIPCHRVLGARGSMTGYAAGVEVKERLLRLERVLK